MNKAHLHRGVLLFEQGRFSQAADELRRYLGIDPESVSAHSVIALCLKELGDLTGGTNHARQAIEIAPDQPYGYYSLARVMIDRNRHDEAEAAILEAIRLNPQSADYLGLLAAMQIDTRRYHEAVDTANRGLQNDPDHAMCLGMRGLSLARLGDKDAAAITMHEALTRQPDIPLSHAGQAWSFLRQGKALQAIEHYREALRLKPDYEWARAGLVEAMKSRSFFYRWLLGRSALAPLGNLALRFDRAGRYALSADQVRGTDLMAACLFASLICFVIACFAASRFFFLLSATFGLTILPASAIYECRPGWPRCWMAGLTIALLSLIVVVLIVSSGGNLPRGLEIGYLFWPFPVLRGVVGTRLILARPRK